MPDSCIPSGQYDLKYIRDKVTISQWRGAQMLLDLWLEKSDQGQNTPSRNAFSLADMHMHSRMLLVCEQGHQPNQLIIRLAGTGLTTLLDDDITGKLIDAIDPLSSVYQLMVATLSSNSPQMEEALPYYLPGNDNLFCSVITLPVIAEQTQKPMIMALLRVFEAHIPS